MCQNHDETPFIFSYSLEHVPWNVLNKVEFYVLGMYVSVYNLGITFSVQTPGETNNFNPNTQMKLLLSKKSDCNE